MVRYVVIGLMNPQSHRNRILEEWTKQAVPFSKISEESHEAALKRMMQLAKVSDKDTVLDVACGPGLVSLAFAPHVKQLTGIDVTPAMIERAQELASEKGILNVSFELGDANRIPYPDETFSTVLTRYSLHHFLEPLRVVKEMVRVCRTGES